MQLLAEDQEQEHVNGDKLLTPTQYKQEDNLYLVNKSCRLESHNTKSRVLDKGVPEKEMEVNKASVDDGDNQEVIHRDQRTLPAAQADTHLVKAFGNQTLWRQQIQNLFPGHLTWKN